MISLKLKVLLGASAWGSALSGLVLWRNVNYEGGRLVMANYRDYISPEVVAELQEKYPVVMDYFPHDSLVRDRFEKGIYDMAIVSTSSLLEMKDAQLLREIGWDKFNLKDNSQQSVNDATKAQELFADATKEIAKEKEILKYGIPYFLNKLSFCYVGEEISELKQKVSFKTLIEKISQEERFKSSGGRPRLGLIDDPRTVLSLARMVKGEDNVNPNASDMGNMLGDYEQLKNKGLNGEKLGDNFLLLNPNSAILVDALAEQVIKGAIMYNGDCLFSLSGGNSGISVDKDKFHTVEFEKDIFALDLVVLSRDIKDEDRAYKFLKELLFIDSQSNGNSNSDEYFKKEGGNYQHLPIRNLDFVRYTPTLKDVEQKAKTELFKDNNDLKDKMGKIMTIEKPSSGAITNYFEDKLSPESKSNMIVAYEKFKLSL